MFYSCFREKGVIMFYKNKIVLNKEIDYVKVYLDQFKILVERKQKSKKTFQHYLTLLKRLKRFGSVEELLDQMNHYLASSNWAENTKYSTRLVYATFIKWLSEYTGVYINTKLDLDSFKKVGGTRQAYSMEEYLKIFNYVELWGDLKFKLVFQILAITGVRIGELANVNWTLLVKNNFTQRIETEKKNNTRLFTIPKPETNHYFANLRQDIIDNIDFFKKGLNIKTIQNKFNLFKHYVHELEPEWGIKISAHMLRHFFIVNAHLNIGRTEEVAKLVGHVNSQTTATTYLNFSNVALENIMEQAQMENESAFDYSKIKIKYKELSEENAQLKLTISELNNQLDKYKKVLGETKENVNFTEVLNSNISKLKNLIKNIK
ncbi:hypothetical protein MBIO_0018 [Mycoplasmopsis fermentans PG18]|uniref:Tyr recombinase domain-containing protein n=2 Tax=Mycoplasmopsis fermentans TaxID=2115 RepID=C4XDR1_MYCFP|nr:hypothetical protein MBIO_0018 [Mycoplasmopsis fermentans PG18]